MTDWLTKNAIRAIAVAVTIALIAGFLFLRSCSAERTAKTEGKLATGQADASLKSGQDAANTVGNRMDADAGEDAITRENDATIRKADGANVPVAAPVHNAGIAALCRRAAYRDTPRCKVRN